MSKRYKSNEGVNGLMFAAYDWVKDVEAAHNVRVRVEMERSTRKGIWVMRMVAIGTHKSNTGRQLASNTREWPASEVTTYEGAFFSQAMSLSRILDDMALDITGIATSTPLEG